MEYIYTGLLLHKAGQQISEENVTSVLKAAGVKVEEVKVKALCAALDGVNIDEAISKAVPIAAATGSAPASTGASEPKPKAKEEQKVSEEEAASGLSGLFG